MSAKAAATRLNILQKAFGLVYKHGYRATSIDDILAETKVTKGAFFYHFKNKDEMGLAMINEVMLPGMYTAMVEPLLNAQEPAYEIYDMMKALLLQNTFFEVRYGCPAINLVEEMAARNDSFKHALEKLTGQWQDAIAAAIEKGKETEKINTAAEGKSAALFIISGYGGIRNLGKIYGSDCYHRFLQQLRDYLEGLKA